MYERDRLVGAGRQVPNGTIMILSYDEDNAPQDLSLSDEDCERLIKELREALDSSREWKPFEGNNNI